MMDIRPTLEQGGGFSAELWDNVSPRLVSAVAALDPGPGVGTLRLSVDDMPGDDDAWYRVIPGRPAESGPVLILSCHTDSFYRHRPLTDTVFPPRAVWDQMDAPRDETVRDAKDFSPERTDIFIHHHLLMIQDLLSGKLVGEALPGPQVEAFAAAWAVFVDGRLARRHLPGYPMAERRGRFSRLFSSAGIILPEHWHVFQSLWDGALADQKAILSATRLLPHL